MFKPMSFRYRTDVCLLSTYRPCLRDKASPISAVINEFAPIVHHGTSKAPFEMGTTRIDLQRVTWTYWCLLYMEHVSTITRPGIELESPLIHINVYLGTLSNASICRAAQLLIKDSGFNIYCASECVSWDLLSKKESIHRHQDIYVKFPLNFYKTISQERVHHLAPDELFKDSLQRIRIRLEMWIFISK